MTSLPSQRSFIRVVAQMIEKDHPHYNTITFLHFFYKLFSEAKKFFFYAKGFSKFR